MGARTHVWILLLSLWVLAGCLTAPQTSQNPTSTPSPTAVRPTDNPTQISNISTSDTAFSCPVTQPNGSAPPSETPSPNAHGNGALWTWFWSENTVVFEPGGPGHVGPDGSLAMKWPWYRGVRGDLFIEGRRLDAPAPPLRAAIPDGYGSRGFQATSLIFPTAGCWEVTGRVGNDSLTFVTLVVKDPELPIPTPRPRDFFIRSELERYDLYPIPASCEITPLMGRHRRQSFTAWWWEGEGRNRIAAGTPIGVFFEGANKVQWQFKKPGELTIQGERVYGPAPPLEIESLRSLDVYGFSTEIYASSLIFPTAGCWLIQTETSDYTLEITVYVYPYGCRPPHLRDPNSKAAPLPCESPD